MKLEIIVMEVIKMYGIKTISSLFLWKMMIIGVLLFSPIVIQAQEKKTNLNVLEEALRDLRPKIESEPLVVQQRVSLIFAITAAFLQDSGVNLNDEVTPKSAVIVKMSFDYIYDTVAKLSGMPNYSVLDIKRFFSNGNNNFEMLITVYEIYFHGVR